MTERRLREVVGTWDWGGEQRRAWAYMRDEERDAKQAAVMPDVLQIAVSGGSRRASLQQEGAMYGCGKLLGGSAVDLRSPGCPASGIRC